MKRKIPLQVYLSEHEEQILKLASHKEGLTKSDIVRRLIRRLDFNLNFSKNQLDSGLIIEDYLLDPNNPTSEVINSRVLNR